MRLMLSFLSVFSLPAFLLASLILPALQNDKQADAQTAALRKGAAYLQQHQIGKAIEELKTAVALDPKSAQAHMLLGEAYFLQGSHEMIAEAKAELAQALAIDPGLIWSRFYLAKIYLELGRTQRAKEELERGLKTKPDSPYFLALLGEANRKSGNPELSVRQNKKALELDPSLTAARYYLGLAHLDLKQPEDAIRELQIAVKSEYVIPEMYLTLGSIYFEKENLQAARELFQKAIALDPSRPEGHLKLAQVYRREKLFAAALKELALATPEGRRFLSSPYFQQLQADVFFETGLIHQQRAENAEALQAYSRVLEISPDHGNTHRQLAEVLFARAEYARSLEEALKAEKLGCPVDAPLLEQIREKARQPGKKSR
ncbi:MAG TPA: tetratricopeptide repeat protein [Acidobacteriota bacterium]